MSREAVQFESGQALQETRGIVKASSFPFWLILGLTAIAAAWAIFSYFVVPRVIESAYRGESLSVFNDMISGQAIHPVEHYLSGWQAINWRVLGMLFGIGIMVVLLGAFLDHKHAVPSGIKILFAADVSLGLAYLLLVSVLPTSWFVKEFLDLDAEANLPTWYSSTKLFVIAVLLSVFAFSKWSTTRRRKWVLVMPPALFSILSLDETAGIHTWLGSRIDAILLSFGDRTPSLFPYTGMWMFYLAPVLLGVIVLIGRSVREYFRDRGHIAKKYVLGIVIFVGSAAGIEIIYNFVSRAFFVQVFFEELGEMIGVTILLWATWDLLVSHQISLRTGE